MEQRDFLFRAIDALERMVWMLTPEDIILAKLLWHQMSPSETQLRDIAARVESATRQT